MPPKKKVGFASEVTSTKLSASAATKVASKAATTAATAGKKKPAAPSRPGVVTTAEIAPAPVTKASVASKAADKDTKATSSKKSAGGKKATSAYQVLQLRHLPAVFQEPELRKFLSQFGTTVDSCYVVRTKSNASRGTAYVKFGPKTTEGQYDAILDECHGMLLGGNTVTASFVTLRREMPNKKLVDARRKLDWLNKTRGRKLSQHDVTEKKSAFDTLRNAAAAERRTNAILAKLGVAYQFHGFQQQLDSLPEDFIAAQHAARKAAGEDSDSEAGAKPKSKASPSKKKAVQAADIEAIAEKAVRASAAKAESTPARGAAGSPAAKGRKSTQAETASTPKSATPAKEAATPASARKSAGAPATPAVRTVQLNAETPKSASRRVDATPSSVKATPASAKAATPAAAKATPKPPSSATKKAPTPRWK